MKMIFKREEKQEMMAMYREVFREFDMLDEFMEASEKLNIVENGEKYITPDTMISIQLIDDEYVIEYDSEIMVMTMKKMNKYLRPIISMGKAIYEMFKGMYGVYVNMMNELEDDVEELLRRRREESTETELDRNVEIETPSYMK